MAIVIAEYKPFINIEWYTHFHTAAANVKSLKQVVVAPLLNAQ